MQGKIYAYRARRREGEPLHRVEVVRESPPKLKKARIRWLDGEYEGLEEWVPKGRLVIEWDLADAFLQDERNLAAAREASAPFANSLTLEAARTALNAVPGLGDTSIGYEPKEGGVLYSDDLTPVTTLLGITRDELLQQPFAFTDRSGWYHAPYQVAERLARLVCERFSVDILACLASEEDAYQSAAITGYYAPPGRSGYSMRPEYARERLAELAPIHATVREWCGAQAQEHYDEVAALRAEATRLRGLVEDTARWLRDAGHPVKSASLLRALGVPAEPSNRRSRRAWSS